MKELCGRVVEDLQFGIPLLTFQVCLNSSALMTLAMPDFQRFGLQQLDYELLTKSPLIDSSNVVLPTLPP